MGKVLESEIRLAVCATCGGWHNRSRVEVMTKWGGWDEDRRKVALKNAARLSDDSRSSLRARMTTWAPSPTPAPTSAGEPGGGSPKGKS